MPARVSRLAGRPPFVSTIAAAVALALVGLAPRGAAAADPDLIFADGFEGCSADPRVGTSCDGNDSDFCAEGTFACVGDVLECADTTDSAVDLCNGADDDCDAASADGAEDPLTGTSCDGNDSDLCPEGTRMCFGGGFVCNDVTGSTVDVCNNVDDDCDPASPDGSEDPLVGAACDGSDSDLCAEGFTVCAGGFRVCSDATGSTVDVCNGVNDDCDAASPDGSEDPLIGTSCDGSDGDACRDGVMVCSGGAPTCNDSANDLNRVTDGGFEAGLMGGTWTESSTNFGTPVCSVAVCGTAGSTGAHLGIYWVWLGGIDEETAFVRQSFVIPIGAAMLRFWLAIPGCDPLGIDTFSARIDGVTVYSATNADARCGQSAYGQVAVDVSAFANGASHTLEFQGVISSIGNGLTSFMVDDVTLESCLP